MPDAPLWESRYDDLLDALRTIKRANGYLHDSGGVEEDSEADLSETDTERPVTHVLWMGALDRDPVTGNQDSGNRNRRWDVFQLSAFAKNRQETQGHARIGNQIYADWERALLKVDATLSVNRNRGAARATTYLSSPEWAPDLSGQSGGIVMAQVVIRHDNVTGTQETQ